MPLQEYIRKRNFKHTPEPAGKKIFNSAKKRIFVVQEHAASHLHYDFRLELNGVLLSWAVPKGPSLNPADKRLAVHVEDHPLDYATFEGVIPRGQYGGGTVMVWDIGRWAPIDDPVSSYKAGKLEFQLTGKKLKGLWALIRMKNNERNWLLIKKSDEKAQAEGVAIIRAKPLSALTGRSMAQIKNKSDNPIQSAKKSAIKTAADFFVAVKNLKGAKKSRIPEFIHPELTTTAAVPAGENWLHEMKLDGYRIVSIIHAKKVVLMTRRGQNWTKKFNALADALRNFPIKNTILDGELVALDKQGLSQFQLLQNVLEYNKKIKLYYYIFDMVYCHGYDLSHVSLFERKALLNNLLESWQNKADTIRYSEHIQGAGVAVFQSACELGMEGIISKRADSFYQQYRSHDWIKTKCLQQQEFVVGGYTEPAGSRQYLGSLLLGYFDKKKRFIYCGHVGTGFNQEALKKFHDILSKLEQNNSPFYAVPKVKNTHWVKPELVIAVEFREWTQDGILRQASLRGLRRDKHPKDVHREKIMSSPKIKNASRLKKLPPLVTPKTVTIATVMLSHPEKLLYQKPKISKVDLANFYEKIAKWILPYIVNRPLTLLRCPEGIGQKCFYQKHINEKSPVGVGTIHIKSDEPDYLFIKTLPGLISLVQWDVLEIHPWGSQVKSPDNPDRIIFDLDPAAGVGWQDIIKTAFLLRDNLKSVGLESFVKTTGGKGLHIVVPLTGKHTWQQVKQFSRSVAAMMVQQNPMLYTATLSKAKRYNKIFIDYLRNIKGATAIAAYGIRAREGAPVSTPVTWVELKKLKSPNQFNFANLALRLHKLKQDPWQRFFTIRQKIKTNL